MISPSARSSGGGGKFSKQLTSPTRIILVLCVVFLMQFLSRLQPCILEDEDYYGAVYFDTSEVSASAPLDNIITKDDDHDVKNIIRKDKDHVDRDDHDVKKGGKFAYANIISGCTDVSCQGYVLNAITSKRVLDSHNSTSDYVFLVRMSATSSDTRLAPKLEQWLAKAGIRLAYLPKVKEDNFGTAVLEKFRILEMTEYDRVAFLDGDLIPVCNLDFALEESYKPDGILSDYVTFPGSSAPVTASIFIGKPQHGLFHKVIDIVKNKPGDPTIFDDDIGWGHNITDPEDYWRKWGGPPKRHWSFKAGASDQGILMFLYRYTLLNYSQVWRKEIETWQEVDRDTTQFHAISVPNGKFIAKVNVRTMNLPQDNCYNAIHFRNKVGDYHYIQSSTIHFAGPTKPWKKGITVDILAQASKAVRSGKRVEQDDVWFHHLAQANQSYHLNLPSIIENAANKSGGNPLGLADRGNRNDGTYIAGGDLMKANLDFPIPRWGFEQL